MTVLSRTAAATAEALYLATHSDHFAKNAAATLLRHAASELAEYQKQVGRELTYCDAISFLCRGAEGRE